MAQYLDAQGNVVEEDRMAKLYLDPETGDDVTGRQLLHRKKVIAQAEENARALGEKPQNFLQASRMFNQKERDLFGIAATPKQIATEIGTGGLGYAAAFADTMLGAAQEFPHIQHRVSTRLQSSLGRALTDDEEEKDRIAQRERDILEASTYHSKAALARRESRAAMLTTPVTGPGKLRSVAHMAGGVAPVVAGVAAAPVPMLAGLALSMGGRAVGDVGAAPLAEILGEEEEIVRSVTGPMGEMVGFVGGIKGGKSALPKIKETLRLWREGRAAPRNTTAAATGAPDPAIEPAFPSIESAMARIESLAKASETTPQEAAAAIDRATGGAGTGKPKSGKVSTDLTGLPGTAASVTAKLMVYRAFDSLFPGAGILAKFFSGSLAAKKAPGFVGKALAGIKGKLGLGEGSPDISSLKPKQVADLVAELNNIIREMEKAQDAITTQMSEGRSLTPVAGEELLAVEPKPTSTTLPEEVLGALRDPATTPLDPRSANLPGGRAHKQPAPGADGPQPFMRPGHPADIIGDANLSQTTQRTARRPPDFIEAPPEGGGPAGAPVPEGLTLADMPAYLKIIEDMKKSSAKWKPGQVEALARNEILKGRGQEPPTASEAPPVEPAPKGPEPVPEGAVDSRGIAIVEAAKFPERDLNKPAASLPVETIGRESGTVRTRGSTRAPAGEERTIGKPGEKNRGAQELENGQDLGEGVKTGDVYEMEDVGPLKVAAYIDNTGKLTAHFVDAKGEWVSGDPVKLNSFLKGLRTDLTTGRFRRPGGGGPEPRRPMQVSPKEQGIRDEIDLIDQRVAASDRRQADRPPVERPDERRVGPRRETEEPVAPAREPGQAALPLEGQTELTGMPEIAKGRQTAAEAGLTVTEAPAGKNKTLWETRNKNGHVIDVTTTEAEAYAKIGRGETDLPIAPRESPPEGFTGPAGEAIADAHGLLAPKTTPAPTEPPAKPAGPSRSTERVFETKSGEPFEKTPLDSEARLTAFERPGGPTDAEWVRMYGTMATKAKRAWLEEAGRIGEKEPLIIDPDGTMRDGEGNIIQPGAPSEVPPQTPPVKPGKQKTAAVGTSAKPGPPPTPPAEVEAALKASLEKPAKPSTKENAATLKARGWSVKKEGEGYSIFNKKGKKVGTAATKAEAMKIALRRSKERGAKEDSSGKSEVRQGRAGGKGLAGDAYPEAERVVPQASRGVDLEELPAAVKVDGKQRVFGSFAAAQKLASEYRKSSGKGHEPPKKYVKVDEARAKRIADAYDKMKHDPDNPQVKAAYEALAEETIAQYEAMLKSGLKVDFIEGVDPYGNPRNAMSDVIDNNHLSVYPTDAGYGPVGAQVTKHPMLATTKFKINGRTMLLNDVFRAVHDYFGHVKEGVGFRAFGEENAWRMHSSMYSELARQALTTETRGQNSWVNYGPKGKSNLGAKTAETVFPEQKAGLLPEWAWKEGVTDAVPKAKKPGRVPVSQRELERARGILAKKKPAPKAAPGKEGLTIEPSGDKVVVMKGETKVGTFDTMKEAQDFVKAPFKKGRKPLTNKQIANKIRKKAEAEAEAIADKDLPDATKIMRAPSKEGVAAIKEGEVRPTGGGNHKVGDIVANKRGKKFVVEEIDSEGRINVMRPTRKIVHGAVVKGGKIQVEPEAGGVFIRGLGETKGDIAIRPGTVPDKRPVYVTKAQQQAHAASEKNFLKGKTALGRPAKRSPKPQNKAFRDKNGNLWGRVSNKQWWERVQKHMTAEEITAARKYYRTLRGMLKEHYPQLSEKDIAIIAFASTQKAASGTQGILNLNRWIDTVAGAKRKKPGVSSKPLGEIFRGDLTISGFAEKLSDFTDSIFGIKVRSWTGSEGTLQPGAIDRHMYLDMGYVTKTLANILRKQGIKFTQDIPAHVGSQGQYVESLSRMNKLTEWLNKNKIDGGAWNDVNEAQAVGWTAIRKQLGLRGEDPLAMFERNFRTVAAEITGFNPASDLGKLTLKKGGLTLKESTKIHQKLATDLVNRAAKIVGGSLKIHDVKVTLAPWEDARNANIVIRTFGSPESTAELVAVLGKTGRQTAIVTQRPVNTGGTPGWVFKPSKKLSSKQFMDLWTEAIEREEVASLGQSWLRLLGYTQEVNKLVIVKNTQKMTPKNWRSAQAVLQRFLAEAAEALYKSKSQGDKARFDVTYAGNADWTSKSSKFWDGQLKDSRPGTKKATKALFDWYGKKFEQALAELKGKK